MKFPSLPWVPAILRPLRDATGDLHNMLAKGVVRDTDTIRVEQHQDGSVSLWLRKPATAPQPSSGPVSACANYNQIFVSDTSGLPYFWEPHLPPPPDYADPAGNPRWLKKWCSRVLFFTFDPTGPSVSDVQAWNWFGFEPDEDADGPENQPAGAPLVSFWYSPDPTLVSGLLYAADLFDAVPPNDRPLRVQLYMTFLREMQTVFIGPSKQHDKPVSLSQADSVPYVKGVCYKIL